LYGTGMCGKYNLSAPTICRREKNRFRLNLMLHAGCVHSNQPEYQRANRSNPINDQSEKKERMRTDKDEQDTCGQKTIKKIVIKRKKKDFKVEKKNIKIIPR